MEEIEKLQQPHIESAIQEDSNYAKKNAPKDAAAIASVDKAIIYIYRDYLKRHPEILRTHNVVIAENLLTTDDFYETWCNNIELNERSYECSKKLWDWFKKARPLVEAWYKRHPEYKYDSYWNSVFLGEIIQRCRKIINGEFIECDTRHPAGQLFNYDTPLLFILTPYTLLAVLQTFKEKLIQAVDLYGLQQKNEVLLSVGHALNQDAAYALLETFVHSGISSQLIMNIKQFDSQQYVHHLQILCGLQANIGSTEEKINNISQLENLFSKMVVLGNTFGGYLLTYAALESNDFCEKCAYHTLNGTFFSENGAKWMWGLENQIMANFLSSETLQEALINPQYHKIELPADLRKETDFYTIFKNKIKGWEMIEEYEDPVEKLLPVRSTLSYVGNWCSWHHRKNARTSISPSSVTEALIPTNDKPNK